MNEQRKPKEDPFAQTQIAESSSFPTKNAPENLPLSELSLLDLESLDKDLDPIEILAEHYAEQSRKGIFLSVDDYANAFPKHEEDIREILPTVAMMEQLRSAEKNEQAMFERTRVANIPDEIAEDFQILREVGRGGMGIVYEAVQKTLQRRVALKLLNDQYISSAKQISRFAREARSAASLHHTNIVPVFGFGQSQKMHYYSMQFIDGVGLDEVISALREFTHQNDRAVDRLYNTTASSIDKADYAQQTAKALFDGEFAKPKKVSDDQTNLPSSIISGDTNTAMRNSSPDAQTVELNITAPIPDGQAEQSETELKPTESVAAGNLGSPYWKSIARIGLQVAEALHHAHSHKVLHRDVKPSNLLLDGEGIAWLTDFGLAKLFEHDDLTRTGDIVGTLRYMAPEQFDGKVDAKSDIYSLGLTLHELLTLKPAFLETAQGRLVKLKTSTTPPAPRTINPNIPVDLETIVTKACSINPSDRYLSAAEMAGDLERFLEDRPISARRVNPFEKAWRWARRNPALAFWFSTAALALVAVAVVSSYANYKTNAALDETQQQKRLTDKALLQEQAARDEVNLLLTAEREAKSAAEVARQKTENTLSLSLAAFDKIFESIAGRGVRKSLQSNYVDEPSITELTDADAKLLQELLGFYEKFAEQDSSGAVWLKKIDAYRKVALIQQRLRQDDEALKTNLRAKDIVKGLLKKDSSNVELIIRQASIGIDIAKACARRQDITGFTSEILNTVGMLKGCPEQVAKDPRIRLQLAKTYEVPSETYLTSFRAFSLFENQGKADRPEVWQLSFLTNQCQRLLDELRQESDDPREIEVLLARNRRNKFVLELFRGKLDAASKSLDEAIDLLKLLAERYPNDPEITFEMADLLSYASLRLMDVREDPTELEYYLEQSVELATRLVKSNPKERAYQALLGNSYINLGLMRNSLAQELAISELRQGETIFDKLVANEPNNFPYQLTLALTRKEIATILMADDRNVQAINSLDQAIEDISKFKSIGKTPALTNPTTMTLQTIASELYELEAVCYHEQNMKTESDNAYQMANKLRPKEFRLPPRREDTRFRTRRFPKKLGKRESHRPPMDDAEE